MIAALARDLGASARLLRKNPGFTAVVAFTLALGIGANTTIFSAAQAVLLRALPYPDADRLVFVSKTDPSLPEGGSSFSYPTYRDIQRQATTLAAFAANQTQGSLALTEGPEPVQVTVNYVPPVYFDILGMRPELGRVFRAEEDRYVDADPVLVLSHGFWQRQFGARPDVVGRTVHLNQRAFTVVGVAPRSFHDPLAELEFGNRRLDAWVPLGLSPQLTGYISPTDRKPAVLFGIGRLKPGVTLAQASADVAAIGRRLAQTYPETDRSFGLRLRPLKDQVLGAFYAPTWLLVAGSALILLIACANAANLLLARLITRQRELALRSALGASAGRLAVQLLAENVLLTVLAGLLAVVLATAGVWVVGAWAAENLPGVAEVRLDGGTLAASILLTLATALLFGLPPALSSSRTDPRRGLAQGGRQGAGLARRAGAKALVVVEVGLALVLLAGAGLLLESLRRLTTLSLGYDTRNLLTVRLDLRAARYALPEARTLFARQLAQSLAALPGVRSATLWGPSMLGNAVWTSEATPEGRDLKDPRNVFEVNRHSVNPGALSNLGIRLLRGRDLTWQDTADTPLVAVVSESVAKTFWPGADPLGKRFFTADTGRWLTVVGVAADARHSQRFVMSDAALGMPPAGLGPQLDDYLPYAQKPNSALVVALRFAGGAEGVAGGLRRAVHGMDPALPLYDLALLDDRLAEQSKASRALTTIAGVYAALALFLAGFGLFAVLAHLVRRRTQEIGIRMALGALPAKVLSMVVAEGLLLALAGVLPGLLGALLVTRLAKSLLFGVSATDPLIYGATALVLLAVAAAASWIPARRAMRVDPLIALRGD